VKRCCLLSIFTCCLFIMVSGPSWAQESGAIEGRVALSNNDRVHRATVLLVELGLTVETDETGRYRFENVGEGTYEVLAFQSILDSESQFVELVAGATATIDIELRLSPLRQKITVTAQGRPESTFQAIPSVTTLDSFDLSEKMATSLGEILDGQPGVAKRSFGAGNARPVVRAFDGDRVLVMQDGMRVGSLASQSGDHGNPSMRVVWSASKSSKDPQHCCMGAMPSAVWSMRSALTKVVWGNPLKVCAVRFRRPPSQQTDRPAAVSHPNTALAIGCCGWAEEDSAATTTRLRSE
jgi:hypothetical protein